MGGQTSMSTRIREITKSIILFVLVMSSVALTVALWVQTPPISSLPPELARRDTDEPMETRRTFEVFAPIMGVLHDGGGNHRAFRMEDDRLDAMATSVGRLLGFVGTGDLARAEPEDVLAGRLLRFQGQARSISLFLAGEIPLDLLLGDLGSSVRPSDAGVDRIFAIYEEDEERITIYLGGEEAWFEASWPLVPGLRDEPSREGFPGAGSDAFGGAASAAWSLAHTIEEGPGPGDGEARVLLTSWRDYTVRPLASIPEMDVTVDMVTARPMTFSPSAFFPDFDRARSYTDDDGTRNFTDGTRTLRLDPDGFAHYSAVREDQAEPTTLDTPEDALEEARQFLGTVMPPAAAPLILVGIESLHARGTLDLQEGSPEASAFRLRFAERHGDLLIDHGGHRLEVVVDARGVRSAVLAAYDTGRTIQRLRGITPLSALERALDHIYGDERTAEPAVHRIDRVRYPAEPLNDDRVVRTAWSLRIGTHSPVLVDATNGRIVSFEQ